MGWQIHPPEGLAAARAFPTLGYSSAALAVGAKHSKGHQGPLTWHKLTLFASRQELPLPAVREHRL